VSFRSHIYDREGLDGFEFEWRFLVLMFLLFLLIYLLEDVSKTLAFFVTIPAIIAMLWNMYKDYGKKELQGKYVGELILDPTEFLLNKERIVTAEIEDMRIAIGHPKGEKLWHRYGYTIASGTKSELELTVKGIKRKYNFLWIDDSEKKNLLPVLEGLYKKRIFVREYFRGERTYLFEELSYEEIQEFKKKYNVW
jgi:hypothetical protein